MALTLTLPASPHHHHHTLSLDGSSLDAAVFGTDGDLPGGSEQNTRTGGIKLAPIKDVKMLNTSLLQKYSPIGGTNHSRSGSGSGITGALSPSFDVSPVEPVRGSDAAEAGNGLGASVGLSGEAETVANPSGGPAGFPSVPFKPSSSDSPRTRHLRSQSLILPGEFNSLYSTFAADSLLALSRTAAGSSPGTTRMADMDCPPTAFNSPAGPSPTRPTSRPSHLRHQSMDIPSRSQATLEAGSGARPPLYRVSGTGSNSGLVPYAPGNGGIWAMTESDLHRRRSSSGASSWDDALSNQAVSETSGPRGPQVRPLINGSES